MSVCALFAIGISLAWLPAAAQNETGKLGGVVQDRAGAFVAGAKAELRSETGGYIRQSETSHLGVYSFDGLPEGEYRLTLIAPGFQRVKYRFLPIAPGEQKSMPILTLSVANMGDCTSPAVTAVQDDLRAPMRSVQAGQMRIG